MKINLSDPEGGEGGGFIIFFSREPVQPIETFLNDFLPSENARSFKLVRFSVVKKIALVILIACNPKK